MAKIQIKSDNPLLFPIYFHIVAIIYYICNPFPIRTTPWLYPKINIKFHHFLFLTSSESPLNKDGSESVWKYRWLLSKCVVECRSLEQPNDALLYTLMMRFISTYKSASLAPNDAHHESSLKHIFNRACWFAQKFLDKFHLTYGENRLAEGVLRLEECVVVRD